jgi:hypothetical protein
VYLSEENDNSVSKVESYFVKNQVPDNKLDFVSAKTDTIAALFLAS